MNDKNYFFRKRTMPYIIIHGFDKCAAINEFLSEDGKRRMSYTLRIVNISGENCFQEMCASYGTYNE